MAAPAEGIAAGSGAKVGHASTRRGRYEFLDALRGVAAMAVVVQHSLELVWPAEFRFSLQRFRPGEFGVVLFFLCSGFIIPASLERHGSQSRFWIGRFFRLYPLYWSVLAAALVLHFGFGRYALSPEYLVHPVRATAVNATMVHDFLNTPLALGQSWSLAYELVFYGLVSALFVAGLHRRSVLFAVAGFALAIVPLAARMPGRVLAENRPKLLATIALTTLAAALVVWWCSHRAGSGKVRWLAVAMVIAIMPLVANRPEGFRTACYFIGTLFAGTALYRWMSGQLAGRLAALVVGAAAVTIVVMNATTKFDPVPGIGNNQAPAEILTNLGAYAVFLAALLFRELRFPRSLLFLGTISYSLYLDHALVIYGIGWVAHNAVATAAVWISLSVVLSAITYRFIERPAIEAGRRVGARYAASQAARQAARSEARAPVTRTA